MFDSALKRLYESQNECLIYTPFGHTRGRVLDYDGVCVKFERMHSGTVILYAEDIHALEEFPCP